PPSHGAPGRNRTCDTRFRKPLLYPLSYEGPRRGNAGSTSSLCHGLTKFSVTKRGPQTSEIGHPGTPSRILGPETPRERGDGDVTTLRVRYRSGQQDEFQVREQHQPKDVAALLHRGLAKDS